MDNVTISRNGAGIPPTRRSRQTCKNGHPVTYPRPDLCFRCLDAERGSRHLEATVTLTDGTSAVERTERNDPAGCRAMDRWALERNTDPKVDYIAVEAVSRIAGYERSR